MLLRLAAFAYGLLAYAAMLAASAYLVGFLGNFAVPKSIDSGTKSTIGAAIAADLALLLLFAIQHSLMSRRGFKAVWTRLIPPPIERSTYVLLSSLVLIALFWLWRPIALELWRVENVAGRAATGAFFWLGWALTAAGSFSIDHFELFGLKQVWAYYVRREYRAPAFRTPFLYRFVRHPLMLGTLLGFWATPVMTVGHLLFAGMMTVYVYIGIRQEEADLVRTHGEAYREYQRQVPMLLPWQARFFRRRAEL